MQPRISSIDALRGIVMILMSLDHASHFFFEYDFVPTDLEHSFPICFYTRWITHICAPVFVFLAGISIHIMLIKKNDLNKTTTFLLKRGFWLIFLELTLLSFFWHTFAIIQLQVIWAIGVTFLLMAFAIRLPWIVNLVIAIIILVFHDLLNLVDYENISKFWRIVLLIFVEPGELALSPKITIQFLYSILPYFGVMLLGFCMGPVYQLKKVKRKRIFFAAGSTMILSFLVLRINNIYGDPYLWSTQEKGFSYTVMSFLNITKYPPSFQYLLLTLGISFILLNILDRENRRWMKNIVILGQVAMFFYIFHIPFLRLSGKAFNTIFDKNPHFIVFYLIWIVLVIILMQISKRYATFKATRRGDRHYWWLKYL